MSLERTVEGGVFVALEGIHGCGKSTQVELLRSKLARDGYVVEVTKEVASTPLADEIYKIAFQENGEAFRNPLIMTLLIAASRASRVNNVIAPVLSSNRVVITDRYEGAMLIYQHYCDGVDEEFIRMLNKYVTGGIRADITFILNVDPVEGYKRRIERLGDDSKLSGWDARSYIFHQRSREGYLKFAGSEPGWVVIDGMRAAEVIAEEIYQMTTHLISLKNANGNS